MLKFYATHEISEVKIQAGSGAQLMGRWPRVLTLTAYLTTLPRGDLPVGISIGDYHYCQ